MDLGSLAALGKIAGLGGIAILLLARPGAAAAKNTVLRCQGHQATGDRHRLTDQIITLDMQNNIVVSIQLNGFQPKDTINAPVKVNKDELQWSYEAVAMKYVFNRKNSQLQTSSSTMGLVGVFECSMS